MNTYTPGQSVTLSLVVRRVSDSELVAPSSVVCTVENPAGVQTTPTVINDDTGLYHALVTVAVSGIWYWRWTGGGDAPGADEGFFAVRATEF